MVAAWRRSWYSIQAGSSAGYVFNVMLLGLASGWDGEMEKSRKQERSNCLFVCLLV